MLFNEEKLLANIAAAPTDDLLDRVTAFRAGMEKLAIVFIEEELNRRGVCAREIAALREQCERECIFESDGSAAKCSSCQKPAVREGWGWHRMLGKLPIFPRWQRFCRQHAPS